MKQDKKEDGIYEEIENRENLLVTFGGVKQGIGIPVFEFMRSAELLNCDKIFFRDFKQAWYKFGVDKNLCSTQEIKSYLLSRIEKGNYKKIVFLGNSMGGFAAIFFGVQIKVDQIIAFSPQTFIDKFNRNLYLDFRWKNCLKVVHNGNFTKADLDLKFFLINNNIKNNINVYFSENHRLDKIHAKRLKIFSNVKLIPVKKGGHQVVKELKQSGFLSNLMKEIF